MITTTLARISDHSPCEVGWKKLLAGLGKTGPDNEPLPFARIVEINGLDDALWCCRAEPQYDREWRLFAVWCARRVQHLMKDPRSIAAIDVAERYANGKATRAELDAARTAARDAWIAVWDAARFSWIAAGDAAGDAARAAWGAAWITAGAAGAAAGGAWSAAGNAWFTVGAAGYAVLGATRDARYAAGDAEREAQTERFLEIVT
jgi:hypothetical protein